MIEASQQECLDRVRGMVLKAVAEAIYARLGGHATLLSSWLGRMAGTGA